MQILHLINKETMAPIAPELGIQVSSTIQSNVLTPQRSPAWWPWSPDLSPQEFFFLQVHIEMVIYASKPPPLDALNARVTNIIQVVQKNRALGLESGGPVMVRRNLTSVFSTVKKWMTTATTPRVLVRIKSHAQEIPKALRTVPGPAKCHVTVSTAPGG